ncbi:MAG: RdgB/HAM1 family non-canonical purine NTP pyrophosphatase [Bryobacteraceae bacterium]|nr:RdgB/HAM1 family non-canonical purine NTP pyrophosphatase [Bryobacteraceae bacterium]MCX7604193.1 RdgB/HAM1 family non-canonical purine NTP pyrophosphatase [Bryobacteraceae bacterium]
MTVRCATGNPGKLAEFRMAAAALGHPEIEILPLDGIRNLPVCEEDGETFEANAAKKALHYSAYCSGFLFADDSGLAVDALDGAPGVRSARFSPEGTDEANNRLLLEKLAGARDRHARFVCVIALAREGELIATFRGEAEGVVLEAPRGTQGFGYDPLFYYPPLGKTFAELDAKTKMLVSHRGAALRQLFGYLARLPG